uniref:Epoxide hydrolase n=1 Tax=Stomoxys calcitrans TaxID=35570 RepID=A0A1I8PC52_STOCA
MKFLIFVGLIAVLIGYGYLKFDELTRPLPLPTFDTNKYWGPGDGSKYKEDKTITPFKIQIDPKINILSNKTLNNFTLSVNDTLLPPKEACANVNNLYLLLKTTSSVLKIHFIHAKPTAEAQHKKKVLPLLLLHGWPGSVREFYDFIPILTEPAEVTEYVFEVVAPSLVGYGWSDAARKVGFNAAEMAIVMRNLMLRLGFEKFLVQGGDWGSIIGSNIATIFPENVLGYHSNMCVLQTPLAIMKSIVANFYPEKFIPSRFFTEHHFPLSEKLKFLLEESGYFHIQATKPDTIGTALLTSPIGLASFYIEKFQTGISPAHSQRFDGITKVFTIDAILDNIMIYYLSNTATTSARFYKENMSKAYRDLKLERVQSPVPMGCARFRFDLPSVMDWQLMDKFPNLIHSKYFNQVGHFAAFEAPVMLYIDFAEFVNKIEFKKGEDQ